MKNGSPVKYEKLAGQFLGCGESEIPLVSNFNILLVIEVLNFVELHRNSTFCTFFQKIASDFKEEKKCRGPDLTREARFTPFL